MLMSVASILTNEFDAVYNETFVSLDDVREESYDPWDDVNDRLDQEGESEE